MRDTASGRRERDIGTGLLMALAFAAGVALIWIVPAAMSGESIVWRELAMACYWGGMGYAIGWIVRSRR